MRLGSEHSEDGMRAEDVPSWLDFECRGGEERVVFLELLVLVAVGYDLVVDCGVGDAGGEEQLGEDVIVGR